MALIAGLDWSGTSFPTSKTTGLELYIPCIVAFTELEPVQTQLSAIRESHGMAVRAEIHAHESSEEKIADVLRAIIALEGRVGALLINKVSPHPEDNLPYLPAPFNFPKEVALAILREFLALYSLDGMWCDEDILNKTRQQEFNTEVKRVHRAIWPDTRLKIRHKASDGSDLIQVADVMAYCLSTFMRGTIQLPELRKLVETIWGDPRNVILGPRQW